MAYCNQCEALSINGVACHETGCPNTDARWDAESQEWIKRRKCFDCGCTDIIDAHYRNQAPTKTSPPDYDAQTFFNAYAEAALWSSYDEATPAGGEPLDTNYSAADLAPETAEAMRADCEKFQAEQAGLLARYYAELPPKECPGKAQAGYDFWLSRNGHGAGFFDQEASREVCDGLQAAANAFGNVDLYVGDDGLIYAD